MNKGHKVTPLFTKQIRNVAQHFKDTFQIKTSYFPIVMLIEILQHKEMIELEIIEKSEMLNDYGLTYPKKNKILIREDVYDRAVEGDGFGRFTLAHELGHLILHKQETVYARNEHGGNHKTIEDSEWQANKFAQELLIDTRGLSEKSSAFSIMNEFSVSHSAANTALASLKREGVL